MRIRFVPAQPHCFVYGGFDIQMHRTLEVLQAQGVDARPLDFWSRDDDFNILHFWGFDPTHLLAANFAKRYGKKVVLTPLLQYLTLRHRIRYLGSWLEGAARDRIALGKLVDRFLVVNEAQGETLRAFYRVPQSKLEVIPTMLDGQFFNPEPRFDTMSDGFKGFLICAGNICARKNQLLLARAAISAQIPVLFAGNSVGGEEDYSEAFAKLIASHSFLRWNKWMAGEELQRAYRAAIGVVLPSFEEQQPTIGLEAAALGKPLMLGAMAYAQQKFYRNAFLAKPNSIAHIATGLKALVSEPTRYTPPHDLVQECRAERIANRLKEIYESLL
jgi:glycosyltransferase involved in cell wall biosynthesis